MQLQGQRRLATSQTQTWQALNDPAVLQACVPGCERFDADGDDAYKAVTLIKIGPVSARFTGKLKLSDIDAPNSYQIAFEGSGAGGAGFGSGKSAVTLSADGAGTLLSYTAQAQVGGKIAQLGQRLIDGVAKTMADDFFRRFEAQLQTRHPEAFATYSIASKSIKSVTDMENDAKNAPQSPLSLLLRDLTNPPWTYAAAGGIGAVLMLGLLMLASR